LLVFCCRLLYRYGTLVQWMLSVAAGWWGNSHAGLRPLSPSLSSSSARHFSNLARLGNVFRFVLCTSFRPTAMLSGRVGPREANWAVSSMTSRCLRFGCDYLETNPTVPRRRGCRSLRSRVALKSPYWLPTPPPRCSQKANCLSVARAFGNSRPHESC
jgi:hypothetical protein